MKQQRQILKLHYNQYQIHPLQLVQNHQKQLYQLKE